MEFVRQMIFSATCGHKIMLEWFVTERDFHLIVYDEWLRDILQLSEEYLETDWRCTKNPNAKDADRLGSIREQLGADFGLRGALIEIRKIHREINDIRGKVISDYEPLVESFINMLAKEGDRDDRAAAGQAARIGLLKAIGTYNHHRNIRFGVYAKNWLRQSILEQKKRVSKTSMYLPASTWAEYHIIAEAESRAFSIIGDVPEEEMRKKVSELSGMPLSKIAKAKSRIDSAHAVSLDSTFASSDSDGNPRSLYDVISDEMHDCQSDVSPINFTRLTPKQAMILSMKFGCWDKLPKGDPSASDIRMERVRQSLAKLAIKRRKSDISFT